MEAVGKAGILEYMAEAANRPITTAAHTSSVSLLPNHVISSVTIEPPKSWVQVDLRELWDARELLYNLISRDIKVRYKQTSLGVAWIILQPLATMAIFSVVFGRVAKMPSDGVPYPIFLLTALIPWTLFSTGVTRGSDSLVGNIPLLKKVYLPRLALPLSRTLAGLLDFALSFLVLLVVLAFYHVWPSLRILYVPAFLLLVLAATNGVAFWLSALNVRMRDVQQAVPFLVQFWFFASPVYYPSSLIRPVKWQILSGLNPMAGVVEAFRWALLGTRFPPYAMFALSAGMSVLLLVSGAIIFRKLEQTFADIV